MNLVSNGVDDVEQGMRTFSFCEMVSNQIRLLNPCATHIEVSSLGSRFAPHFLQVEIRDFLG
jgi:hypothetical protein